jgi:hypothetical protein
MIRKKAEADALARSMNIARERVQVWHIQEEIKKHIQETFWFEDAKPIIGFVIFLINRWSCSIMLFKYLTWHMSIIVANPARINKRLKIKSMYIAKSAVGYIVYGELGIPIFLQTLRRIVSL